MNPQKKGNKMIEKLEQDFEWSNHALAHKINELVDIVNELQKQIDKMSCAILDLATPNGENKALESIKAESKTPADPYAEQRKWIGCLCRFWNFKDGAVDIGILKAVDNLIPAIPYISDIDCSYAYCEPVKQDDDIIYKGEQ